MSTALYCRDRVNPAMFNYCLSVAMLHRYYFYLTIIIFYLTTHHFTFTFEIYRPDTRGTQIPTLVQNFPDRFFDSTVFAQAREEAQIVNPELRVISHL